MSRMVGKLGEIVTKVSNPIHGKATRLGDLFTVVLETGKGHVLVVENVKFSSLRRHSATSMVQEKLHKQLVWRSLSPTVWVCDR